MKADNLWYEKTRPPTLYQCFKNVTASSKLAYFSDGVSNWLKKNHFVMIKHYLVKKSPVPDVKQIELIHSILI